MKKHPLAPLLVLAAGVCWGLIGLFSRTLTAAGLNALQVTEVRCVLTAAALPALTAIFDRSKLRIRLRDGYLFVGTGVVSIVFFNVCYFLCMERATLSVACTLLYTSPVFVTVLGCLLLGERFTRRKAAALLLSCAGCVLVTGVLGGGQRITLAGLLTGVGSGFGYALYSIIGRFALRKYHWLTVVTYTFVTAALALAPFCGMADIARTFAASPSLIPTALAIALISTLLPFWLYTVGLTRMDAGKAAVLAFVEPIVATIVSAAVFHEAFGAGNAVGVALMLGAITLLSLPEGARASR